MRINVKIITVVLVASIVIVMSALAGNSSLQPDRVTDVLFVKNCASCHGKDGRSKTLKAKFKHARNLSDPIWQSTITDEHIYESILRGRKRMPAFESKLSKPEIAALVTYVRMLKR